jgi:hypothetical protein
MVAAAAGSASPQPGLWWNPQESGRGFAMDPQGVKMVVTVFAYDDSGQMRWYYADGPLTAGGYHWSGELLKFDAGQPLNGAYQQPRYGGAEGTLTLDFTSRATGFATLPGGRRIAIERQNFGAGSAPQALLGQWAMFYLIGSSSFGDAYVLSTIASATSTGNGVAVDAARRAGFEYQVSGSLAGQVVGFRFNASGAVLDQYVFSLMLEEGRGNWVSPLTFTQYGMNVYKTHTASGMSKAGVESDLVGRQSTEARAAVPIEKLAVSDAALGAIARQIWEAVRSVPR